jgi:hypothetical protein
MLFATQEHALETRQWEDKSALLKFVNCLDDRALILGDDAAQEDKFYSVVVHYNYAGQIKDEPSEDSVRSWGIGVISEGHGLKPELVVLKNGILVIGLNHEVVGVSVDNRSQLFKHSFDSLFHAFLYLFSDGILLVLNEIGVVALDENGNELWSFTKDVITAASVRHSQIDLHFMDSESVHLDLRTGRRADI